MRRYFTALLMVLSICAILLRPATAAQDVTPPTLAGFTISPTTVTGTGDAPQTLTFTATATDDLSGVAAIQVTVRTSDTNANILQDMRLTFAIPNAPTLSTGTISGSITLPQFSHTGTWVVLVEVKDAVQNVQAYTTSQLAALGFASTFTVQ